MIVPFNLPSQKNDVHHKWVTQQTWHGTHAVFFSLQSLCLMHTGKPTGLAVSHCMTWFQTQLILSRCLIRYHSHLWDHRSTGQL